MYKKFSIICATLDDTDIIRNFIDSIEKSFLSASHDLFRCEIIIIDQSTYRRKFGFKSKVKNVEIIYIHSKKRGLSFNRNIGLKIASGDYFLVFDSDCTLDINFFDKAFQILNKFSYFDLFFYPILSVEYKTPIFRHWPNEIIDISKCRRFYYATSVNIMWRKNKIPHFYDEDFGLGSYFPSCEDIDFALRFNCKSIFIPEIKVFHPYQDNYSNGIYKLVNYSFGFGALCRKHIFPVGLIILLLSLFKKILDTLFGNSPIQYLVPVLYSRLKGFFHYKRVSV